jgi:hypothetical protein
MVEMNKPNFVIVGASKSGTTSFAKYLNQHPDIFIQEAVREPRFFVKEVIKGISKWDPSRNHILKSSILNFNNYKNLFDTKTKYKKYGEKSIHYFNHPEIAIKNIKKYAGDIPIIILLRNPVDRMISNWKYLQLEILGFDTAINKEGEREGIGYNSFWLYKKQSLYYKKVKLFREHFSNVIIILFEDFIADTNKTLKNCVRKMDLQDFNFKVDKVYNSERLQYYINIKNQKSFNNRYFYFVSTKIMHIFVKILNKYNFFKKSSFFSIKSELAVNRNNYNHYFYDDIVNLEKLLGRDLSNWK